jgi:hypothetical protein
LGRRLTARGSTRFGRSGLTTSGGKGSPGRVVLSRRTASMKLIRSRATPCRNGACPQLDPGRGKLKKYARLPHGIRRARTQDPQSGNCRAVSGLGGHCLDLPTGERHTQMPWPEMHRHPDRMTSDLSTTSLVRGNFHLVSLSHIPSP